MKVTCEKCHLIFDDARRNTICPHPALMSDEALAQKDLAFSLIGKKLNFNHEPNGPGYQIESIGRTGMISLKGFAGEFAPHLFVVKV
jgi:hypothetical protein